MKKKKLSRTVQLAELFLYHPSITDTPADIQAFIDQQIQIRTQKLRSLMARWKLSPSDIRQDFIMAIVEAMPGFNPARSTWRTYLSRVLNNRYCNFKRQYNLDRKILGDIVTLDTLDEDDSDEIPTYTIDFETRADLKTAIETLPACLRPYAELLKTNSPAQVASALNVSRSSVCRAVKRIREHFLDAGLKSLSDHATN